MTRTDLLSVLKQWERSMPSPKLVRDNMLCCGGSMGHQKHCRLLAAIRFLEGPVAKAEEDVLKLARADKRFEMADALEKMFAADEEAVLSRKEDNKP